MMMALKRWGAVAVVAVAAALPAVPARAAGSYGPGYCEAADGKYWHGLPTWSGGYGPMRISEGPGDNAYKYGSQPKGINIISTEWPQSRVTVLGQGLPGDGWVTPETNAAIYMPGGGYLKYGVREWGINLVWSATPVYEWRIVPHECGQRILNLTRGAYLVGQMQYGVDWGWGQFEEWEG
ncbi:hypothetical protein [Micromonospora sp. NPDC051141]|uniref:hypothetical protein n=1 Tax=Micromonospora sp. NPDC051141 TaxID=3364284 RepID=UPI0037AA2ABF